MKKILITIIIFMFTATVTGYAQFFKDNNTNRKEATTVSSSFSESRYSSSNSEEGDDGAGFFKASTDGPGGRPGTGGGVGQSAPLDDGLSILIVCCVILVIVRILKNKWDARRKSINSNINSD